MSLNVIWYILLGVLFTGYAILDGFDLGVGALHLFARKDEDRRIFLNAIGPVWDGNEVWLVTGGGALFAAFPEAYATAFSGFYPAFMGLLAALIFRAVAIEFRSKLASPAWRRMWDYGFAGGSILASFLIGVAVGDIATGIPLDGDHEFAGSYLDLLQPYGILIGVTTIALFMMHGCIYLVMKTEGELQERVKGWVQNTIVFFIVSYSCTALATLLYIPHMAEPLRHNPLFFLLPVFNVLAIANVPREIHKGREFRAFLSSCAAIASLTLLFGVGMFPNLITASPVANSLNIWNAASSQRGLGFMLTIAIFGVPVVLAYTASIYWIFRGKVKIENFSY